MVKDDDGNEVKSRRQKRNDSIAAAAAEAAAAAASAPDGWARPAKRCPQLAAVFGVFASRGTEAALEEGQRSVGAAARALREKTSNLAFLQAKLDLTF